MVFLGFVFGTWLSVRRAARAGVASETILDLIMWILFSSIAGARLTYVLTHLDEFQGRWLDVISPIQSDGTIGIAGLVLLGGVAAAIPVSVWFLKRKRVPVMQALDILIPALAFGIAIGRVGCLLNGCCFGVPTKLPWGLVFPDTCLAGMTYAHQSIHPTQLYAIIYSSAIGLFLLWRTPRKAFEGELFALFLALYGVARFLNETVRYYREGMILLRFGSFELTLSMMISALLFGVGLALLIRNRKP